jgi:hypothetical protein
VNNPQRKTKPNKMETIMNIESILTEYVTVKTSEGQVTITVGKLRDAIGQMSPNNLHRLARDCELFTNIEGRIEEPLADYSWEKMSEIYTDVIVEGISAGFEVSSSHFLRF